MPLVAHADKLRAEVWLGRARILDVGDARVVVDGGFLTALAGLERVRQFVVTLVPGVARCAVWARVFHRRFGLRSTSCQREPRRNRKSSYLDARAVLLGYCALC
jgi:hypothetical protein